MRHQIRHFENLPEHGAGVGQQSAAAADKGAGIDIAQRFSVYDGVINYLHELPYAGIDYLVDGAAWDPVFSGEMFQIFLISGQCPAQRAVGEDFAEVFDVDVKGQRKIVGHMFHADWNHAAGGDSVVVNSEILRAPGAEIYHQRTVFPLGGRENTEEVGNTAEDQRNVFLEAAAL